jgi:crotonobetainyl-CoA:carnitine CoA-transferase CaiB-like acyl-CoA transferase
LYDTYNSGKLGLALDLSSDAGRAVAADLARWADVLIESFAPGQMARWGLSAERLRADNPGLIGLSTSLMGQSGPYSSFAGFGNIGGAVAGYQGIVGHRGKMPIGPFGPYTDYVGPRFGLVALLARHLASGGRHPVFGGGGRTRCGDRRLSGNHGQQGSAIRSARRFPVRG